MRVFCTLLLVATTLGADCSSELGEPCSMASQCPTGSVCRNNLYMDVLCQDGVVPVEGQGPDGYCTMVCADDEDCADVPGSEGCKHDPRSDRLLCMPDCP